MKFMQGMGVLLPRLSVGKCKMDYIPKDLVKKYGYTWDFDEELSAYAR